MTSNNDTNSNSNGNGKQNKPNKLEKQVTQEQFEKALENVKDEYNKYLQMAIIAYNKVEDYIKEYEKDKTEYKLEYYIKNNEAVYVKTRRI